MEILIENVEVIPALTQYLLQRIMAEMMPES